MDRKIAISVRDVAKKFRMFSSPAERIREALHPMRRRYHHEFWALTGINFDVYKGEVLGVLGRNGSGKSTLLQIICSVMRPTRGEVVVNGRISALLELGAGFDPSFSGRENVILNGLIMGIARDEMLRRLPEIEAFADIGEFFDQPVKTYSSGMFVRVAFAAAIHVDPEILIVDEALSVGDTQFQHRCYQKIRSLMDEGRTILVVSHATDTLLRICERGLVIESGTVYYEGKIDEAVHRYHDLLFGRRAPQLLGEEAVSVSDSPTVVLSTSGENHHDVVHTKAIYNPYETRLGVGGVKIVDFDLVVDGVVNPEEFDSHGHARLVVKVFFEQTISNVCLGFSVLTVDGVYIFGINDWSGLSGEVGQVKLFALDWRPHMAGGEYYLSVGCHLESADAKTFLDVRRSFAKVRVRATNCQTGFADLEGVWSFPESGALKQTTTQSAGHQ